MLQLFSSNLLQKTEQENLKINQLKKYPIGKMLFAFNALNFFVCRVPKPFPCLFLFCCPIIAKWFWPIRCLIKNWHFLQYTTVFAENGYSRTLHNIKMNNTFSSWLGIAFLFVSVWEVISKNVKKNRWREEEQRVFMRSFESRTRMLMGMGDDEKNPCGLNMENKNKNKNHLNDDHSLDSFLRNITCPNISV